MFTWLKNLFRPGGTRSGVSASARVATADPSPWVRHTAARADWIAAQMGGLPNVHLTHQRISARGIEPCVVSLATTPRCTAFWGPLALDGTGGMIIPHTSNVWIALGYWSMGRQWVKGTRDLGPYTPLPADYARPVADDCLIMALGLGMQMAATEPQSQPALLLLDGYHAWLRYREPSGKTVAVSLQHGQRGPSVRVDPTSSPAAQCGQAMQLRGGLPPGTTWRAAVRPLV